MVGLVEDKKVVVKVYAGLVGTYQFTSVSLSSILRLLMRM